MTPRKDTLNNSLSRPFRSDGYSLVEVLVAIVILSVGLLGTASLLTTVIRSDKLSVDMSTATSLAKDKIEKLKTAGCSAASNGTETATVNNTVYTIETVATPDGTLSVPTCMVTVEVTVSWNSFGSHSMVVRTIISG